MCRVLGVSRSGFYAWRSREPSAAEVRREELTEEVKAIHAQVKARYGGPRIHAELAANGHACSVNFVARVTRGVSWVPAYWLLAPTSKLVAKSHTPDELVPVLEERLKRAGADR
ncbi:hypothetical protein GobsT_71980 [Gemmata obscuriglobus]|uniref:HTH-like domain-containing protein n=1 Tax=Gemmata obscuriglobus TaxID=114 RepID=A0A2Z3H7H2_9BACT|nr:IS3 family transposase [Gemmata obscuriglobus]AWM41708.1 hypothetical protein C1280_35085 [Gemmata obscuriglobus]QEG32343.1 hypothetical protein GobsT_71980 [Gemmata obscuriglobus]VTS11699.1 Transposase InsF for insertion sequence IS3A/B/C/D/E/fA OS=Pseudomonas denitrificans ATCC 13867 GN=H681_04470 PE=4 SV=1: HTH_21 [Gemmata obscuriglobus UQM 2246]